jgi:hypothetical protein
MEQENFSPQESLALIRDMIAKTRSNMDNNTRYFLLWGWATFAALTAQFLLKRVFEYDRHYLVWWIVIPTSIVSILLGKREQRTMRTRTYMGDSMQFLWIGIGISFFVLSIICNKVGWGENIYPFFMLLYGLGTFVSGRFLQFTPLVAGGIIAWALAIAAAYLSYDYQILCAAAAIMASYIIPAYLLRRRKNP